MTEDSISAFQVVLRLTSGLATTDEELEAAAEKARDVLVRDAGAIALGPVAGVDFRDRAVEVEFTVPATRGVSLYLHLGEILRMLTDAGFEFEASTEARLEPKRELAAV
jgi:hypothetical protein